MRRLVYRTFGVILVFTIIFSSTGCVVTSNLKAFSPENPEYVNYNNYFNCSNYHGGLMDYRNGILAYRSDAYVDDEVVVGNVQADADTQYLKGVNAPFQLTDQGVLFKEGQALYHRDREGNEVLISQYADRYAAWKNYVIYIVISSGKETINTLYLFDLQTQETIQLKENINKFNLYDNCVYAFAISEDMVYRIPLDTLIPQAIGKVAMNQSFEVQFVDGYMVRNYDDQSFVLIDLNTFQTRVLPFNEDPNREASITFLCEGDIIYYSCMASIRDGSLAYPDFDHPQNGTWKLNIHTGEKECISKQWFFDLYCFDKTHLYGVNLLGSICEIEID